MKIYSFKKFVSNENVAQYNVLGKIDLTPYQVEIDKKRHKFLNAKKNLENAKSALDNLKEDQEVYWDKLKNITLISTHKEAVEQHISKILDNYSGIRKISNKHLIAANNKIWYRKKGNLYIIFSTRSNKKGIIIDGYVHLERFKSSPKDIYLYRGNYFYTEHFFDRMTERLHLRDNEVSIKHFLQEKFKHENNAQRSRILNMPVNRITVMKNENDNENENDVVEILDEGIGLGTALKDETMAIIKTFVDDSLLSNKQFNIIDDYLDQYQDLINRSNIVANQILQHTTYKKFKEYFQRHFHLQDIFFEDPFLSIEKITLYLANNVTTSVFTRLPDLLPIISEVSNFITNKMRDI